MRNNATYRFDFHLHRRTLETTVALRFTGGHDHGHGTYNGAVDTFIDSSSATTSFGSSSEVNVNDPIGAGQTQGN